MKLPKMLQSIKDWPLLRHLFSKIPGPILAKLTGLWKLYHLVHGSYADRLRQLHSLHGKLATPPSHAYTHSSGRRRQQQWR